MKALLEVEIRNPALVTAVALDMNGNPIASLPLDRGNGGVRLLWPPASMYVVLTAG